MIKNILVKSSLLIVITVCITTILMTFVLHRNFDIEIVLMFETLVFPVIILTVILLVSSFFVLGKYIKKVINNVNEIDIKNIDDFEDSIVYEEFYPLIKRIKKQQAQIKSQMKTLGQKQEEFTALTKNMKEAFLVLDKDGKILFNNKSASELLEMQDREYVGEYIINVDRSEAFRESIESAIEGKTSTEMIEKRGNFYRFITNPVILDNKVAGIVVLLMDITEQHTREKLRREFTANVSHELKTPLTSISGYAELISNGIAKEEDILTFAKRIYKETQRMIDLVRDLLLLSQLDEQDKALEKEPCNLLELAKEVAFNLASKGKINNIDIIVNDNLDNDFYNVDETKFEIVGVASVLYEMIYNLVENGIKYNKVNGKVFVDIINKDGKLKIKVRDTGIGIPLNEQERVFERFYRVDKSRNQSISGTGMGLSIVKHGAILHDGFVVLESKINVGTTITVQF